MPWSAIRYSPSTLVACRYAATKTKRLRAPSNATIGPAKSWQQEPISIGSVKSSASAASRWPSSTAMAPT